MIDFCTALQIARSSKEGIFVLEKGTKAQAYKGDPDRISMIHLVAFVLPSTDGIFYKKYADPTSDWEFRPLGRFDGSECPILVYKDEDVKVCKDGGGAYCIFDAEEEDGEGDEEGDDGGFSYR